MTGDASRRQYTRLVEESTGKAAILMDAPPSLGEDILPFLKVGSYLRDEGFSAPEIYDADERNGFLILEDFGDALFDKVSLKSQDLELEIYKAAIDVLVKLTQTKVLSVDDYRNEMASVSLGVFKWYVEPVVGTPEEKLFVEISKLINASISALQPETCTILRDFHAQNLIWLPERSGVKKVGLLDFQDAMTGPVLYDFCSLITDARRDVSDHLRQVCFGRFQQDLGLSLEFLERDFAICSIQRNLRILMVFARMSLHFKKPNYVDLIPRVWGYLMRDLGHPDFKDLKEILMEVLPAPTPQTLKVLKEKCGTIPHL